MITAKDIMHTGATCVGEHETLAAAAHVSELGVGALPICWDDDRLHRMLTDRDIVIKCIAAGPDPNATTAGEVAQSSTYHVDADASIEEMLNVMEEHQVRRLPPRPFCAISRRPNWTRSSISCRQKSAPCCSPSSERPPRGRSDTDIARGASDFRAT